jgi:cell division inhibitor SepF
MHHNTERQEYDDDTVGEQTPGRGGFLSRFFGIGRAADDDEMYEEDEYEATGRGVASIPTPGRSAGGSNTPLKRGSGGNMLRLEAARRSRVTVRRMVQSFEDVRRAVDELREGRQQIINLEQTPSDMSERLIDFLNGATYALDGSVEKIGDQVYLFTPANVTIDVEEKTLVGAKTPFFDRA